MLWYGSIFPSWDIPDQKCGCLLHTLEILHLLRTTTGVVHHDHSSVASRKNCWMEKDGRNLLVLRRPVLLEGPFFTPPPSPSISHSPPLNPQLVGSFISSGCTVALACKKSAFQFDLLHQWENFII